MQVFFQIIPCHVPLLSLSCYCKYLVSIDAIHSENHLACYETVYLIHGNATFLICIASEIILTNINSFSLNQENAINFINGIESCFSFTFLMQGKV